MRSCAPSCRSAPPRRSLLPVRHFLPRKALRNCAVWTSTDQLQDRKARILSESPAFADLLSDLQKNLLSSQLVLLHLRAATVLLPRAATVRERLQRSSFKSCPGGNRMKT